MKNNSSGPLAGRKLRFVLPIAAVVLVGAYFLSRSDAPSSTGASEAAKTAARPALTVSLTTPQQLDWPIVLPANGNVVAWQEAVIGAEIANYRITELAEAQASVAELDASATEAKGNAERAKELKEKGFYSSQLNTQYQTAQNTAQARLAAARARQQAADLKMSKTAVLAPDDGVISARSATVGSLTQTGQELFRLIRGGRLEWRAEVPSADLGKVKAGVVAILTAPGGETVKGTVRTVSPSVDPQTRNGLVYVDLPVTSAVRAGMFARGEFSLAQSPALTLPQSAVVLREGFGYVFRMEGEDRVAQAKVVLGRRLGERIEILSGLEPAARVVATGAGFLADGDVVKVVDGVAK